MSKYRKHKDEADDKVVLIQDDFDVKDHLPVWRKICFAIGGAPYQMTNTVINFFFSIFLLEVAEIRPSYASIIVFAGKAWDACTDPLCGFLISKTNTSFGKFRPWILFSAPFACVAYFFLWYVPDFSEEGKLGWYFVFYCLFQSLMSGLHVPYTSLTMVISNNQEDRDSATAYRMGAEAIGVLSASVVQGAFVEMYRTAGECKAGEQKITEKQLDNQKWSYQVGAAVMIAVYLLASIIVFVGTKERIGVVSESHGGLFKGLKLTLSFRPYKLLSLAFLFLSLGIAIVQGNLALYCTHSLELGEYFNEFITVLLVSAIICIPIWQIVLVKVGKKTAFAIGMSMLLPVLLSQLYIPAKKVWVFYPILVIAGASIAVALLLPWSMLPDVLDEFMLETGTRQDAIFYSFYVFFSKFSVGVGLGLSQLALAIGGYQTGECDQPSSVELALRVLVVPGPFLFTLIALVILWKYPIDEKRRMEIREEIEKLKIEQKCKSDEDVEPLPPDEMGQSSRSYQSFIDSTNSRC